MKTLKDLFEHQLKDLYSAENQLLKALPKVLDHVHDKGLRDALESHREQTEGQRERIKEICDELGIGPGGEECKAMRGLIEETEHFLGEEASDDVRDAGIIANCQRIEHYEIAGYGTAVRFAKQLGHKEIADRLQEILDQEYDADDELDRLAEGHINEEAME